MRDTPGLAASNSCSGASDHARAVPSTDRDLEAIACGDFVEETVYKGCGAAVRCNYCARYPDGCPAVATHVLPPEIAAMKRASK